MSKRRRGYGSDRGKHPPAPPPPPPPWATLLECTFKPARDPAQSGAQLSLAIEAGDGEVLSVRLRHGDLAVMVAEALMTLTVLGDPAAPAAHELYCKGRTGSRGEFRPPDAPAREPGLEELRKRHGRGYKRPLPPPLHPLKEPPPPFARATGRYLKVRFADTPGRSVVRIAILGGFECRQWQYDGLVLACRWRLPVRGGRRQPVMRDFFVLLEGHDVKGRKIKCIGTRFYGRHLSGGDWEALSDAGPHESVGFGGTKLTCVPFRESRRGAGGFGLRTAHRTYRVDVPIAEWQRAL